MNITTKHHFNLHLGVVLVLASQLWSNAYRCICRKASGAEEAQRRSHSSGTVRPGKLSSSLLNLTTEQARTSSLYLKDHEN